LSARQPQVETQKKSRPQPARKSVSRLGIKARPAGFENQAGKRRRARGDSPAHRGNRRKSGMKKSGGELN
jgi:hypothetical protein